ncbi:energy transducer TonB [Mucilaginibacter sp. dw_454]|uniref:energy transducer TonB n=1 Tax=Mucilaginibacter sp. dw_454 TaxID=2720079 RepID=UPI001BD57724|nr:energy transducer TonB [Mucilaginibacter sp. dw_454]
MFKTLSVFLLGLMAFQYADAQKSKSDTLVYYFNGEGGATVKDSAEYSLLIWPKSAKDNNRYPVFEYYKDGKIKLTAFSTSHSLNLTLEGPAISYYPNGNRMRTMSYQNGKVNGEVIEYFSNGNKSKSNIYKNGYEGDDETEYFPNGKTYLVKHRVSFTFKYVECWDSTGVAFAKNGNGRLIDYDADLKIPLRQISLKDGQLFGKWKPYEDSTAYATYDRTGSLILNPKTNPSYKGDASELDQYLQENIIYPDEVVKNRDQGEAQVSLIVEKNGALTHLKATQATSKEFGDEAARLIGLSALWKPGLAANNSPLRVPVSLNLHFDTLANGRRIVYVTDPAEDLNRKVRDGEYDKTGEIYSSGTIDIDPVFANGQETFSKFIADNVKYPAVDRANYTSGKVYVQFVVEQDGQLSKIHALSGPSVSLKNEAERVLETSPAWAPGLKDNKPVRVAYTMPIIFNVNFGDQPLEYSKIDEQPQFPGGMEAFGSFLSKHLNAPNNGSGSTRVVVYFVIEKDGSLSGIAARPGPPKAYIDEAIRVMKLSPNWLPGKKNNVAVRVSYTLPINFTYGN